MPPKPKRKQQSAKPPANQKGKKTRKEAEKEVANVSIQAYSGHSSSILKET